MTPEQDRIVGTIVGGAIGDALCGVSERKTVSLSDDTQLTLATCESMATAGMVSPEHLAATFFNWFKRGLLTGLGSSTLKALRDLEAGSHWALAGAKGERSAGNGAAMRIAPLAFLLNPRNRSHRVLIRDVCRITHHNDEAYVGALAVLLAIRSTFCQSWSADPKLFLDLAAELPDSRVRDQILEFANLAQSKTLLQVAQEFGASGFVAETVPLSILAAQRMTSSTFETILKEISQIDGDADTIGSLAGQIAGAHFGYSRLPQNLIALIPESNEVVGKAFDFASKINCQSVMPKS